MKSYRCVICGYIHVGNNPPESCPICGASSAEFEIYEDNVQNTKQPAISWRCLNCEYVFDGKEPPSNCPICGAIKDIFEPYNKEHPDKISFEKTKIVIIGGGIAGLSSAEEIRNNTDIPEITLISAETELPYYRLNLTRYIANEIDKNSLTIYPKSFYDEKKIKLILGVEVLEINKDSKYIQLNNGNKIEYDKLILANGAHPFVPPILGNDLKNVITVRNIKDADFLIEKMQQVKSCICIGGGILGLEVAGAIANCGVKVTLLEGSEWLMPRQLNKKASVILKKYIEKLGIEVRENIKIQEIVGKDSCEGVKFTTGEILPANLVIITAGVRPNTHLVRKCGLEVNMGLVVNDHMQTSDENIFAAGDITEHYGTLYGLWNVAQFQGKIAAQNAIGMNTQFGGIPRSNVLKVLGLDMFSIGDFIPKDGGYYHYEKDTNETYINFVIRDGKILGSIIIGGKVLSIKVKQAVEKGLDFPRELYDNVEVICEKLMNS
jgi:nitrite reductase (NADH) large subunit